MIETFKFVLRDLTRSKLRTFLTLIGIFIGMSAVVALTSLSIGLRDSVLSEIESLGTNRMMITLGESSGESGPPGSGSVSYEGFPPEDVRAVENTRGVDFLVSIAISTENIAYRDERVTSFVAGLPSEVSGFVEEEGIIEFEEGRMLGRNERGSAVVGKTFANQNFERPVGLRQKIKVQGEEYNVVGIMKSAPNPLLMRGVIVHEDVAKKIKGDSNVDIMVAVTEKGYNVDEVKERIERRLENSREDDDFSVTTAAEMIQAVETFTGILNTVLGGVASISLIVGALGITNTMYMNVTEKRKEIGIMKAIGATNKKILTRFLIQSSLLGMLGGLIGVILGFTTSKIIESYISASIDAIDYSASLTPAIPLAVLLLSGFLGGFAGVFPARQAARLPPVEAMRK